MRRLLFFPGHRILAYEWDRGAFRRVEAFEPDEAGRRAFRAWLAAAPRTPVQLLLDVIEEEFHIDHVPHVIGRDRSELLKRTLQKHFRSTDFRYIERQGREAHGRRDDRLLVAGLTNPDILRVWTDLVADVGVPLKGIHSLPLVGERLLPRLGAGRSSRVLLVSQQVSSTLRQSYYEHGRLRFSRLAPGRYHDVEGFATFLRRELDQTLHFLETHRFRGQDAAVQVYILVSSDAYHALRDHLSSSETVTCHLVPLDRIAERVGMRGERPGAFADTLFAHLLLRQRRPANHYGLPRLRRHFFVQRIRVAMQAAATAMLVAALAVALGVFVRGQVYEESVEAANERAVEFEHRYEQRLRDQADLLTFRAVRSFAEAVAHRLDSEKHL